MNDQQKQVYHNSKPPVNSFLPQATRHLLPRVLPQGHRFFQDCLRENYARWIEWAIKVIPSEDVWFASMTFKRNENLRKALTLNYKWICRLFQAYEYKAGHRIRWIRALALQRRGVYHFHLAICGKGLGLLSRKRWEHRWEAMDWNTGTCRIYESDGDLPRYLAREISKEGELSWGGNWQGLNTPGSVRCCDIHAQHAEAIIFRLSKSSSMHHRSDTISLTVGFSDESLVVPKSISSLVE